MKTLRGRFSISAPPGEFTEIELSVRKPSKEVYYTLDRGELRERVIKSGVYTKDQVELIEKEGCKNVIGNGLCVSPFSGYKYYLSLKKTNEIIKGLKILMEAVASDSAEIIAPKNNPDVIKSFEKCIVKSPNVYLHALNDYYPLGLLEVLHKKLSYQAGPGDYFPGKEGILIIPIEDLFSIYLQVEEPENSSVKPVMLITEKEKFFIWVEKECKISDFLSAAGVPADGIIVRGDLLRGSVVAEPWKEEIGGTSQVFVVSDTGIKLNKCIGCGRCREVCPVRLRCPHSMAVLRKDRGIIPFEEVDGCVCCGLCGYYCPGWKR